MKLTLIIPILIALWYWNWYGIYQDCEAKRQAQVKINRRADMAYPMAQRNAQRIAHADEMYILGKHKR